jgi:hypothetical protein
VGFAFNGPPRVRDLEPVFSSFGGDWIRYSTHCWILWTDKPVEDVYGALIRRLSPQDQILVAGINLYETFGYLSPWMWTWMHSKDPTSGVIFGDDLRRSLHDELDPMLPGG